MIVIYLIEVCRFNIFLIKIKLSSIRPLHSCHLCFVIPSLILFCYTTFYCDWCFISSHTGTLLNGINSILCPSLGSKLPPHFIIFIDKGNTASSLGLVKKNHPVHRNNIWSILYEIKLRRATPKQNNSILKQNEFSQRAGTSVKMFKGRIFAKKMAKKSGWLKKGIQGEY